MDPLERLWLGLIGCLFWVCDDKERGSSRGMCVLFLFQCCGGSSTASSAKLSGFGHALDEWWSEGMIDLSIDATGRADLK